jgi:ribose transport system ATP-binding protein
VTGIGSGASQSSADRGPDAEAIALRGVGLRKSFGGVEVLHGVDIELRAGEVHALVGENGAGKSTMINLLTGRLRPDGGRIELAGKRVEFRVPIAAKKAGVSVIAQELEVVPTLTIVENVFLGAEPTNYGMIRWRDARRRAVETLRELGLNADPDQIVGTMGVADQQLVEIAKAVVGDFRVLIMDEPTSALNLGEVERLFSVVRRLRDNGVAVLYVSHRLWEIFDLADRVTVVRDGARIISEEIERTDVRRVIKAMLGSKTDLFEDERSAGAVSEQVVDSRSPALELTSISSGELVSEVSIPVREGEVIGLAGVLGSGRTELCEAVAGLKKIDGGEVRLAGHVARIRTPMDALKQSLFVLPEDRKQQGIFGHLDVRENVVLNYDPAAAGPEKPPRSSGIGPTGAVTRTLRKMGLSPIHARAERRAFDSMRTTLGIKCSGPSARITSLSGGNQQKAMFARAALTHPSVLVLSEPTRGVDVGAKEEIYSAIDQFAAQGLAVLVSSSEISELMRLASRIHVLRGGQVVATVSCEDTSEEEILRHMAG